jgi:hypothetical protein
MKPLSAIKPQSVAPSRSNSTSTVGHSKPPTPPGSYPNLPSSTSFKSEHAIAVLEAERAEAERQAFAVVASRKGTNFLYEVVFNQSSKQSIGMRILDHKFSYTTPAGNASSINS